MDLILGKSVIPKSTKSCYIIRPQSKTFISGLASTYSLKYDSKILKPLIPREQFTSMISSFNDSLIRFWPCGLSITIGYLFCPLSCGLSFMLPNLCIKDAENSLVNNMEYFNTYRLRERGLEVVLVKRCSTSWIELRVKGARESTEEDALELMSNNSKQPVETAESSECGSNIYSSETISGGNGALRGSIASATPMPDLESASEEDFIDYEQNSSLSAFNNLVSDAKRRSLGMMEEENPTKVPGNPFDGPCEDSYSNLKQNGQRKSKADESMEVQEIQSIQTNEQMIQETDFASGLESKDKSCSETMAGQGVTKLQNNTYQLDM